MKKQFVIEGETFITEVKLNFKAERTIGGKVWHQIITNNTGASNFYKTSEVESKDLLRVIEEHRLAAKESIIPTVSISKEEQLLIDNGFK